MSVQEVLRSDVGQRMGARRFVGGIVLGLAILQALWILTVPPFRASDEFDHAYRAAAVARGQWQADRSRRERARNPGQSAGRPGQGSARPVRGPGLHRP